VRDLFDENFRRAAWALRCTVKWWSFAGAGIPEARRISEAREIIVNKNGTILARFSIGG
jgi:hypothetical protein